MPDVTKYTYICFHSQLKKIRKAFGYTQGDAGILIGVSRSHWCSWEKKVRVPDIKQLIDIAKIFSVDVNYFFIEDADPLTYQKEKKPEKPILNHPFLDKKTIHLYPFAETHMAKFIFRKLAGTTVVNSLAFFHVYPHSGISTILREFGNRYTNSLLITNYQGFQEINSQIVLKLNTAMPGKVSILVFDKAEQLTTATITEICRNYANYYSIAFFSIDSKVIEDLTSFVFDVIRVDELMEADFNLIAKALFPLANPEAITLLRIITNMDLIDLYRFRIQAEADNIVSREDVYNHYLKINSIE